jgi:hypothetical protein
MMSIGRSSRRENLLVVKGVEPMDMIRTHLANHIRASSPKQWLHQTGQTHDCTRPQSSPPTQHLTQGRRPHMTNGKTSKLSHNGTQSCGCAGQTVRPSPHSISQTSVGKLVDI